MNTSEGLARVARVVRWIGWLCLAGWAIFGLVLVFIQEGSPLASIGLSATYGCACLGASYAIAYVIDGFAKPK